MNTPARVAIILTVAVAATTTYLFKTLILHHRPTVNHPAPVTMQATAPPAKLPKLIDLGAGKCVPCKMMAPVLEELKTEFAGRMIVEFIDVWENPDADKAYNIEIIPTQIFQDAEGKELFRHTGFFSKQDILGKWQELGVNLTGK